MLSARSEVLMQVVIRPILRRTAVRATLSNPEVRTLSKASFATQHKSAPLALGTHAPSSTHNGGARTYIMIWSFHCEKERASRFLDGTQGITFHMSQHKS
eukprot:5823173-Amphidinium_carterae.1